MFRNLVTRSACLALLGLSAVSLADDPKPVTGPYSTDLQQAAVGKLPEHLAVLNGAFSVAEAKGNKFIELAGAPLDSYGVLFGAEGQMSVEVSARIEGTNVGKMFPEFGIGANDSIGWKLWVLPGQNAVILRKKEAEEVARVPFQWTSGSWTKLKLRVTSSGEGKWKIDGKAWAADQKEPETWTISTTDTVAPPAGRASIWGHPYSGTPIRFDDLSAAAPIASK